MKGGQNYGERKEKILCRIQKNGEKISFKTDFSKKRF